MKKLIFQKSLKQKGFTLIELLIVICIIGILTALVVLSLSDLRKRARDTKRKADLTQIRVALNLYYEDNSFFYPECGYFDEEASDFGATADCYYITLNSALTEGPRPYVAKLPEDPKNVEPYVYKYVSDGKEFVITYETEDSRDGSPILVRGW